MRKRRKFSHAWHLPRHFDIDEGNLHEHSGMLDKKIDGFTMRKHPPRNYNKIYIYTTYRYIYRIFLFINIFTFNATLSWLIAFFLRKERYTHQKLQNHQKYSISMHENSYFSFFRLYFFTKPRAILNLLKKKKGISISDSQVSTFHRLIFSFQIFLVFFEFSCHFLLFKLRFFFF